MIRPLVCLAWLVFIAGVVVTLCPTLLLKIIALGVFVSVVLAVTELD